MTSIFLHREMQRFRAGWPGIAAFCLPLLVYLLTLSPSVYNLDSAELTTAAYTAGITRATGYPLYLSLGYFWSHLPLGDVGYRMNLLSAFSAAAALLLCERILSRLEVGVPARLCAVGLLAFSRFFWAESLIAEVYTLQTALMAALLLALLDWNERPAPARLGLVGLGVGLGLSHHLATLLLLPGIAFYLLASHPRQALDWKALLWGAAGLLAGLSFYFYLPLRYQAGPAFNYAGGYDENGLFHALDLSTLGGVWWLVSGQSFQGLMFAYPPGAVGQELLNFGATLAGVFFVVGIGPGLVGLMELFRRRPKWAGMTLMMAAGHVAFYADYRVADKALMFLPVYLIFALWIGSGCEAILRWVAQPAASHPARTACWSSNLLAALFGGMVIFALVWNWPLVDLSEDYSTRQRGETLLAEMKPGALVFGYWDTVPIIQYLQLVEGRRPDVQAINRFMISPENMLSLIDKEASRRPVYASSSPDGLPKTLIALPGEVLYEITPR